MVKESYIIMAEDSELWDIICDGQHVPIKEVKKEGVIKVVARTQKGVWKDDWKKIKKGYKAKNLLVCGRGPNEYNKISVFESTKKI